MASAERKYASYTYHYPRELNVSHDNHASNDNKAQATRYKASPIPSRPESLAYTQPSLSTCHDAVTEPGSIRFVTIPRPWCDSRDTTRERRQPNSASKSASALDEWLASSFHDAPYNAVTAIAISACSRSHDARDKVRNRRPEQDRKVSTAPIQR